MIGVVQSDFAVGGMWATRDAMVTSCKSKWDDAQNHDELVPVRKAAIRALEPCHDTVRGCATDKTNISTNKQTNRTHFQNLPRGGFQRYGS